MKRIAVLVAVLSFSSSCGHVPIVVDCAQEVSAGLLPAVESALVGENWVNELTRLVAQYGECVIRKAVVKITGEARRDSLAAPSDLNARRKIIHGQQWLIDHPGV